MPSPALPAIASPALAIVAAALAIAACTPKTGDDTGAAGSGNGKDTCKAAGFQSYVGQRVDVLNEVELPAGTRVMFPTTPATMDFREERLNIGVGKDDHIARVFCG
jgi:Peptidase inhibitor I78 family